MNSTKIKALRDYYDIGFTSSDIDFDITFSAVLPAILLASQCQFALERYEDCCYLLEQVIPLESENGHIDRIIERSTSTARGGHTEINIIACMYCVLGKAYDGLDNQARSRRAFMICLRVDTVSTT